MTGSIERMIVLGSTGSIGSQALDVLARFPERFAVVGLAAGGRRLETLAAQMRQFCPAQVAVPHARDAEALARLTPIFEGRSSAATMRWKPWPVGTVTTPRSSASWGCAAWPRRWRRCRPGVKS